jgi:hypothetical protein
MNASIGDGLYRYIAGGEDFRDKGLHPSSRAATLTIGRRLCENRNSACDVADRVANLDDGLASPLAFENRGETEKKRRSRRDHSIFRFARKFWSGRRGSNPRPRPWQGRALPLSYTRIRMIAGELCRQRQSYAKCGSRMQQPARNLEPPKIRISWESAEFSPKRRSKPLTGGKALRRNLGDHRLGCC